MSADRDTQGAALRRALAERGCACGADEAARLADLLLDLAAAGLLVPVTPRAAVHGPRPQAEPGAVVRCASSDPIVYNMGSSVHRTDPDAS